MEDFEQIKSSFDNSNIESSLSKLLSLKDSYSSLPNDNVKDLEYRITFYSFLGDVFMVNEKFNEASTSFYIAINDLKLYENYITESCNEEEIETKRNYFDSFILNKKFVMAEAHLINELIFDGEVYQFAWGTTTENQINGKWKPPERIFKEYPFIDNNEEEFFQRIERNREIGKLRKKKRKENKLPHKISFVSGNNKHSYHGIVYVSCGNKVSCSVSCTGHLFMWGSGEHGCLGTCDTNDQYSPKFINKFFSDSPMSSELLNSYFSYEAKQKFIKDNSNIETTYYLNNKKKPITKQIEKHTLERSFILDSRLLIENIIVIQVSFGYEHSIVLSDCGKVFTCGVNEYGQLGRGEISSVANPFMVNVKNIEENIIQVSAGWFHSIALANSGVIYVWGRSEKGALGITLDSNTVIDKPFCLSEFTHKIRQVECGMNHTLVLTIDGNVFSCGDDYYGQLGRIINKNDKKLCIIRELVNKDIRQIAAGSNHSIALSVHGNVYSWGHGKFGQLGYGHGADYSIPEIVPVFKKKNIYIRSIFAGGDKSACISMNESLYTFGYGSSNTTLDYNPTKVNYPELKNEIITLSIGMFHLSVIKGKRESKLISEFSKLLNNSKFSDIEFIFENYTFKAHKVILLCSSKYFAVIFDKYWKHSKSKIYLDESEISYSIFSLIMHYCYTNRVVITLENVEQLLQAAKIFKLTALLQLCENVIHENAVFASNTLPLGFNAAFENPSFYASDVTLLLSNYKDKPFYCHKVILSLRCIYFQRMFESSFIESSSNEIEITGSVSRDIYCCLLQYIYTGTLSDNIILSEENYYELTSIAHEYQLTNLVNDCANHLESTIDINNVIQLIQFANMLNLEKLFKKCRLYIRHPVVLKTLRLNESINELDENIIEQLNLPPPLTYWKELYLQYYQCFFCGMAPKQ